MYSSLPGFVGDWFPILLDAAIKGTAVLLLAGVLLTCMRRASAAARHVVCFSATVSLLLLPLASVVLPGWQILPQWYGLEEESAKEPTPTFEAPYRNVPVLAERAAPPPVRDVATTSESNSRTIANSGSLHGRTSSEYRMSPSGLASDPVASSEHAVEPLLMWLAGFWTLGTLAVFATILLSRLSLFLLERRAKRIADGPWLELLKQTAGTLKIRQGVALLQTDGHSMPLAAGLLRPRIILPADFSSWSDERRHVVMLHELGHVRRRDCLTKMIAQTACALYWFNPLIWLALKWTRIEAEQACDNLVLASGSDACDYAEHLLQVASDRQANRLAACSAIAMARSSKLESRLRAILDPHRRRRLTRLVALVLTVTVVGTAALIGCVNPASPGTPGGNGSTPTSTRQSSDRKPSTSTTVLSTDDSRDEAVAETTPAVTSSPARGQLTRFEKNHKYGFKNDVGETVIPPKYDDARDFSEGLAAVKMGGRWGYIDARGKLIVPITLYRASPFSEGLALVSDLPEALAIMSAVPKGSPPMFDGAHRYIDTKGKTVITRDPAASFLSPDGQPTLCGRFREGVAPVHYDRSRQNKDWLTRFIDKRGQVVFEVTGYAYEFSEGLARISISNPRGGRRRRYGFVDHKGEIVIESEYGEARDFSDGLSAVRLKNTLQMPDSWGYIDKSGEFVFKPQFTQAYSFSRGVARVHVGAHIQKFKTTTPMARSWEPWEGGEWRLIDKKGNVLKRSKDPL